MLTLSSPWKPGLGVSRVMGFSPVTSPLRGLTLTHTRPQRDRNCGSRCCAGAEGAAVSRISIRAGAGSPKRGIARPGNSRSASRTSSLSKPSRLGAAWMSVASSGAVARAGASRRAPLPIMSATRRRAPPGAPGDHQAGAGTDAPPCVPMTQP